MGEVDGEIGLRCLGRPHAAQIAGHFGIEVECDEIGEMILAQFLGGQPLGAEVIHADR